jgi:hypothetical protein
MGEMAAAITTGHCPACGYRGFVFGPRGGSSVNIECGNVKCRTRYNIATDMWQRVIMVQEIDRNGVWPSEPAQPVKLDLNDPRPIWEQGK